MSTAGILFAAGKGSRLRPLTDTLPKPLVSINQKTLLYRNMESLYPLVDEYVIVVHWLKEQIEAAFGQEFHGKNITYAVQDSPVGGTLDALRVAINSLTQTPDSFLISNSDNICGPKFYKALQELIQQDPQLACLTALKWKGDLEELKSFGVFQTDDQQNLLKIVEKPTEFVSDLVNIGIYYFPIQVLDFIPKQKTVQGEEFITDLFSNYLQSQPIKLATSSDYFLAVTTPDDIVKAEEFCKSHGI